MHYELTDDEWLPSSQCYEQAARRATGEWPSCRQWLFWGLRSGAPWRDLPDNFGPCMTCYNRFLRSRRAGVWVKIMNALAGAHGSRRQDSWLVCREL